MQHRPAVDGKLPLNSGIEFDALSEWRRWYRFRAGARKFAKRKYNRRVRRVVKSKLEQFKRR